MKVLKDILTSKKGVAMLSAIAVYAVGKFGLDVSPDTLAPIWKTIAAFIVGQGIADAGKSAALIKSGGAS